MRKNYADSYEVFNILFARNGVYVKQAVFYMIGVHEDNEVINGLLEGANILDVTDTKLF